MGKCVSQSLNRGEFSRSRLVFPVTTGVILLQRVRGETFRLDREGKARPVGELAAGRTPGVKASKTQSASEGVERKLDRVPLKGKPLKSPFHQR